MAFDWGSLVGAAVSLYSADRGASAARDAGKDATNTANSTNAITQRMLDESIRLNQPFYNTGVAANDRLSALFGLPSGGGTTAQAPNYVAVNAQGVPIPNAELYDSDPMYRNAWDSVLNNHQRQYNVGYWNGSDRALIQSEIASRMPTPTATPQTATQTGQSQQAAFDAFRNTPGYQFGMNEGSRAVQSGAAARGQLNSGKTLKDLMRFGQGYADQQGYRPYVSDLMQLSGRGQAMASQQGQQGLNVAGMMGSNLQNASTARQNSTYAANQAWQNGMNNAAGFFGDWYGGRG